MSVLITGGTGFIGPYVISELLERGEKVVAFDIAPSSKALERVIPEEEVKKVKLVRGNILNYPEIFKAVKENDIDRIIHLAALRNVDSQENPYAAFKLNCEGTLNIFEVARQTGIKRVVYASSVAVYDSPDYYSKLGFDPLALGEEAPVNPRNFYGVTKAFDEFMGEQYHEIYGLDNIGVRLAIIFGPGKDPRGKSSMFNEVIEIPASGKKYIVVSPSQKFSLQYVKDAAHALVCACFAENPKHRVYNTGGKSVTLKEMGECVAGITRGDLIDISEVDIEVPPTSSVDYSKAKEELGYEPRYSLEEGIKDHINIIRKKTSP